MSQQEYRYKLSENDLSIIKHHAKGKPISENARKTLTILSEVFGGLHHLDHDQLRIFDYHSSFYNQYLLHGSLATFDGQQLTLLVIIAHDMAVRVEIQPTLLDSADECFDGLLLKQQLDHINAEGDYHLTAEQFMEHPTPYFRLLFHQRQREGDFSKRHPTLDDTTKGFRDNNKRFA